MDAFSTKQTRHVRLIFYFLIFLIALFACSEDSGSPSNSNSTKTQINTSKARGPSKEETVMFLKEKLAKYGNTHDLFWKHDSFEVTSSGKLIYKFFEDFEKSKGKYKRLNTYTVTLSELDPTISDIDKAFINFYCSEDRECVLVKYEFFYGGEDNYSSKHNKLRIIRETGDTFQAEKIRNAFLHLIKLYGGEAELF